jgi:anti-sigma regulatory factor (Ser/Thr protein kinase)
MSDGKAPTGRSRKVSRYTLEPSTSALTTLREFLRATLKSYPDIEPYIGDIVSATHEAAKNAVVHNPESSGPVDVTCEVTNDTVVVEVKDRGKGFVPGEVPVGPPDPESLAGRGIYIMHALMDDVETESGRRGTRVRMVKRLHPVLQA